MVKIRLLSATGKAVTITAREGRAEADYSGFRGKECERLAERAETLLASRQSLLRREKKPEYYVEDRIHITSGT